MSKPSSQRNITLVANADDFGLSHGVNRGILAAFQRGILRSASLMPNGRAFDDAVQIAKDHPGLGVGIHLSLVGEKAVAPPSSLGGLVDGEGRLPASYMAFARAFAGRRFGKREIETEVQAQIARVWAAGIVPTHLDSHQHVHLLPGVWSLVSQAARDANIRVIRVPRERGGPNRHRLDARGLQLQVLSLLSGAARKRARRLPLQTVDRFWGLGVSGELDEIALCRILNRLRPGVSEVMSHPGFADDNLRRDYAWNYNWDAEVAALCSPRALEIVAKRRVRLAHFGNAWD